MTAGSDPAPEREALFAAWLARHLEEPTLDIEALCAEHPAEASELRRLHAEWLGVKSVFERAGLGLARENSGPVQAGVAPRSELLERLARKGGTAARYRTEGELARGGMGSILRVFDEELGRPLAMKVILGREARPAGEHPSLERRRLARFLEEAQITGQLDHPGIVPVHELGVDAQGRAFFTMKLVQGRDLAQVFEHVAAGLEGWNETRALGVLLKVCEALAYAHSKGVIHRDLKPANVMVGSFGEVYVMDWGLARVLAREDARGPRPAPGRDGAVETERQATRADRPDSSLLTMEGDVVGTPAYMPPEQALGEVERLSPRSDVYAVGALLYHLLARRAPFAVRGVPASASDVLQAVRRGPPESLASLRPDVPVELLAIVEKAMARAPERRYADTMELAEDLRAYLEHRVVRAHQTGAWVELVKWVERNRALAVSSAAAILVLFAGGLTSAVLYARAAARAGEVLRLSALQRLEDLGTRADELWPAEPANLPAYSAWLQEAQGLVAELPTHERTLAELRSRLAGRADDGDPEHWWLGQLERLVAGLAAFADPRTGLDSNGIDPVHGWGVPRRAAFAAALEERSLGGAAAERWARACASIADAHECPAYGNLRLVPQLGLVPLGRDPGSGLWEFAHLASGVAPERGADGKLVLGAECGLVFVLLPGGEFWMGAQAMDPAGPNHDPHAVPDEGPPRLQRVEPFFLSKYELTRAQWKRFTGADPLQDAITPDGLLDEPLTPVERVSWAECELQLTRLGLALPSEAQWEYGARAGTTTPWWCPGPELDTAGNIAYAFRHEAERLAQGGAAPSLAPIGHYRPNPFGLHDTLGNAWEWCQDRYLAGAADRVYRGGSFDAGPEFARSADRSFWRPGNAAGTIGVRPALALRRG